MPDQEFKRHIAFKFRIGDLLIGKPIMNSERFSFLEFGGKKIIRVNVAGNVVDKYEGQGESKFLSITIDDGSGQIKLKSFGDDTAKFSNLTLGQTVIVIGLMRHWNNEIYIAPEIIREQDSKYLLIRKIEIDKEKSKNAPTLERSQIVAIKDRVLNEIKSAEEKGGIEREDLILTLREISPEMINQEIQKLLEDGIAFEPRPGKVRYLG
ncbi:OB-fold nucleic acid binding domain-containing protein [Candidatus Pacearchaeota archaeon]|nr:OB-fold nucleic acid binding domain-containing protein [Candidatus Pacearchaeota archaeon]